MSQKKKQHYVPKFYLRNFSNNSDGKTIGIYNIKTAKYVPNGSLKNQAYANYFYGKDAVIEDALCLLEGEVARIISNIITTESLPKFGSSDHVALLTFTLFLSARTKYNAQAMNEMLDKQIKTIFKDDPRVKDSLYDVIIEHGNAAALALKTTAEIFPAALDLKFKLLVNDTNRLFIASDNPVVKYNQFMETRKTYGSNVGYAVMGLQVFIPLSPRICLMFFDSGVYRVGGRKAKILSKADEKDVDELNQLQLVNANYNLFFNQEINLSYIDRLYRLGKKYLRSQKGIVTEHPLVGGHSENSTVIHMRPEDVRTKLKLTFVGFRKRARQYELGNKVAHYRKSKFIDELLRQQEEFYASGKGYLRFDTSDLE